MGHFSADPGLLQAFSCGLDPFIALAANWLRKGTDEVRVQGSHWQTRSEVVDTAAQVLP